MSDFSDRPFVAGELIGLRAFAVDELGRFEGPAFGGLFKPGVNHAVCGGNTLKGQMQAQINRMSKNLNASMYSYAPTWTTFHLTTTVETSLSESGKAEVAKTKPTHIVGGVDCTCGYYAYFNGQNTYAEDGRVSALVRGSGVCTVGSKGFRAAKAELVALVLPKRRAKFPSAWWHAGFMVFFAILGTLRAIDGDWGWFAFDAVNFAVQSLCLGLVIRRDRRKKKLRPLPIALIRRNYPDVPVYRTVAAAIKAHPLTAPAAPTPADDDFWTREVTG